MNRAQADHRRHLVTIAVQFVEGSQTAWLEIGHYTVHHLEKIFVRDLVSPDRIMKRGPSRISVELPVERVPERRAPALQRLTRCPRLVAQVVAITHERVDGAHGVALLAGEQNEGVVEVLGALAGDAPAKGIDRKSVV